MKKKKGQNRTTKKKVPKAAEQKAPTISKKLKEELLVFLEYHPAKRLSRNLRSMVLEYMITDGATEVNYLQDLLYDLSALFELLDTMEQEYFQES